MHVCLLFRCYMSTYPSDLLFHPTCVSFLPSAIHNITRVTITTEEAHQFISLRSLKLFHTHVKQLKSGLFPIICCNDDKGEENILIYYCTSKTTSD